MYRGVKKRVISYILHMVNNFCGNLIFDNNLWNFWIFFTNNRIRPFKKKHASLFFIQIRWGAIAEAELWF